MPKLKNRISNKVCPEGMTIEEWQIALRREQAIESDFSVEHLDDNRIWGDYLVSSQVGGRYKVAFRGVCSERNYCSCLDFRTNGLGTCKHLEAVTLFLQERVEGYPWSGRSYNADYSSVFVSYKGGRHIRMRIGTEQPERFLQLYNRYFDEQGVLPQSRYRELGELNDLGASISPTFRVYEDVYDFAQEKIAQDAWQEQVAQRYPEGLIPWSSEHQHSNTQLEEALYNLSYHANGLIIAPRHHTYIQLALRLALEVYKLEQQLQASYIIVEHEADEHLWQSMLAMQPSLKTLPIQIITEQNFIHRISSIHPSVCFVWVDNARGLRDWKNELSLSLKKLSISHLYMRIDTMTDLSPIQLSSTLQHISPYLLGALYCFVHSYRHLFPIQDDGRNAPEEIRSCVFFYPHLAEQGSTLELETIGECELTSGEKVQALLQALLAVSQDVEAMKILSHSLNAVKP